MTITGTARLGKKTKALVPKLLPNDFAIIDHENIDIVCADSLIASGVKTVINQSKSLTGVFPTAGPLAIVKSGILLIDQLDSDIFSIAKDGEQITIDGANIITHLGETITGTVQTQAKLSIDLDISKEFLDGRLEDFAKNTTSYIEKEKGRILYDSEIPDIKTKINERPALVVVRGHGYKDDIYTLRSYINEMKPVLIAVDGAADALIELGHTPDIIVGDMDSVSDAALLGNSEVIVHAFEDGSYSCAPRMEKLGIEFETWALQATSEDLGLLLAWECGADLIVAVGTHSNLVEFLEKGREGMASSFLVRLKVGTKLVDAKGVNKLYRSAPSPKSVIFLIGGALIAILAIILASDPLRNTLAVLWLNLRAHLGF